MREPGAGKPGKSGTPSARTPSQGGENFLAALVALISPMSFLNWLSQRGDAAGATISILTRQLGTLLRAGVQLSESLAALIEQAERPGLKRVLSDIKIQVNEGLSLSQALGRHPRIFPELYTNMVAAGEAAGNLEAVLFRLADFMESQNRLKSKVTTALFYPAVMMIMGGGILMVLMSSVVPKVTSMYADSGRALPIYTQLLIFISDALTSYLWLVAPIIGGLIYLFLRWQRTWKDA